MDDELHLSDTAVLARWCSLVSSGIFIVNACGGNEECIKNNSSAIGKYVEDTWEDYKYYIDLMKDGSDIFTSGQNPMTSAIYDIMTGGIFE